MKKGVVINLDEFEGIGVILSVPSGVEYTNQVGGYACLQPSLEGVFVPMTSTLSTASEALYEHFMGPKWKGHCYEGIDNETADFIDGIFLKHGWDGVLSVNRERLAESYEAWIHVRLAANGTYWQNFGPGEGVLTWENSD